MTTTTPPDRDERREEFYAATHEFAVKGQHDAAGIQPYLFRLFATEEGALPRDAARRQPLLRGSPTPQLR
jgi:hypothetical protein